MSSLMYTAFEVVLSIPYTEKGQKFTANLFYTQLLNSVNEYVNAYKQYYGKNLILDFSGVKQIEPMVLANLVVLGLGLNKLHRSITIIRNAKGEVANFFSASGFKSLAEKEKIYIFTDFEILNNKDWRLKINDCRMFLHYFKFPKKYSGYTEYDFNTYPNISQKIVDYLLDELEEYEDRNRISNIINDEIAVTDTDFKDFAESLDNPVINAIMPLGRERFVQTGIIFKCILENIKNAFMHGLKGCVVMVFAEPLKSNNKEKISIAVADIGTGIPLSMSTRDDLIFEESKIKAFNYRTDLTIEERLEYRKNYRYILECIFYRARKHADTGKYKTFGIFDVICSLLNDNDQKTKKERKVYIHSDKVRLCLTNNFYNAYLKPCINKTDGDVNVLQAAKILSEQVYAFDDKFSYIKLSKKFGGAHFEYEFFVDKK